MGQCMSRKAAGAFAASAAAAHTKPTKMQKQLSSPGDEDKDLSKKSVYTKGVSTSFGFKHRPATAPPIESDSNAARRLANTDIVDRNGNDNVETEPLTANLAPTGRSTPRLMPPKKEATASRVNRFGFRQPQVNRFHKATDLNNSTIELCNNNVPKFKTHQNAVNQHKFRGVMGVTTDSNKNRMTKIGIIPSQAEKYMLQSTQLPRPEPVRLIETKTAKTLANNSKRFAYHEDNLSKDGSLTEDSGVGSQVSGCVGNAEVIPGVERLNSSPTYGVRRSLHKSRNLEMVVSGNMFNVRDLDDNLESCVPLPRLPSAFSTGTENLKSGGYQNSGFVREKAKEYQRHLDIDNRRKISITSSEGFSDDYGDENKTCKDKYRSEKTFVKPNAHKIFLKSKTNLKDDSSPPSSDEHEWIHGGEAMADEVSFSISSSDESKEKDQIPVSIIHVANISSALQNLMNTSIPATKPEIQNALLTIEDPKFAAVAAASSTSLLLEDETSPVDSLISCSESEEILKRKLERSSSNSKDINEKLTPPSPGTPTNASNSLSLSDGKDDFLIDDEIADQPALVFEETLIANEAYSISQNTSDSTATMVDSTPKPKRRNFISVEGSPLSFRKKKLFHSRAGSLDTLSPCESITSDDLMMDYDYSQSSGLEDIDKNDPQNHGFCSLDESILRKPDSGDGLRDWSALLGNTEKCLKSNTTKSRLLWSRTGTPNSIPDSPKSLDSKSTARSRHSVTSSPLRLSRPGPLSSAGYDSDDSIRLDRANHSAMKQDIMSIKTMLLKLRRVLNESETHIPFDGLTNGVFNGLCSSGVDAQIDETDDNRLELAELRKQVLFLQGQLEDREKTVQVLQEQMIKLANDNYTSNSAPASTVASENLMCNAATQTERVRPISAGPSLLNGSPTDNIGSLVSASESLQHRRSRPPLQNGSSMAKQTSSRLWRKPGEPSSPQRYTNLSSIPRRTNSRTRTPSIPS